MGQNHNILWQIRGKVRYTSKYPWEKEHIGLRLYESIKLDDRRLSDIFRGCHWRPERCLGGGQGRGEAAGQAPVSFFGLPLPRLRYVEQGVQGALRLFSDVQNNGNWNILGPLWREHRFTHFTQSSKTIN